MKTTNTSPVVSLERETAALASEIAEVDHKTGNGAKADAPELSVKPTIPSERVPDFPALANEFRSDADFALYEDLTQRGDKALRRKLFMAARTFVSTAREHRATFKAACKPLGIKGDNIEGMAIRFLFGLTLDKHAVHDSVIRLVWPESLRIAA